MSLNQATIYVVAFTTAYNSIFFPFVMSLFIDLMKGKTGKKKKKKMQEKKRREKNEEEEKEDEEEEEETSLWKKKKKK